MVLYLVIFGLMSLLYVGLGIPLAQRRVKRNHLYGLRVGETMASDAVWYEANEICGREFVAFGWISLIVAVGLAFVPWPNDDVYPTILVVVHLVGVLVVAGRGMATAREIHARVKNKTEPDTRP
jgi:uncharacterized membrane protein